MCEYFFKNPKSEAFGRIFQKFSVFPVYFTAYHSEKRSSWIERRNNSNLPHVRPVPGVKPESRHQLLVSANTEISRDRISET